MTNHIIDVPRCALWVPMGFGKTVGTLTALDMLLTVEPEPTLVIAPKRVARGTWPAEARKWEHLRNIEVSAVTGDEQARVAALRRDASVYTINYDNLPWLLDHLGGRWPFRKVVADEATRLKSFRGGIRVSKHGREFLQTSGGMRARALARVAHKHVSRFIELSGTPSPNGLQDLWGQVWYLDGGQRLGRSFKAFEQRWFRPKYDGYGLEPLPGAQEQIQTRLRDICISLNVKDYFDVAEPVVNNVYVELPAQARALYRNMEREMFLQIEGHDVEAFNAAARTMKCLQLANGAIYVDPNVEDDDAPAARQWKEVHDAKLQALESIINEAGGMPVLVAYNFKSDLARLLKAFPAGRVLDTQADEDDWNAGKIPVLFVHPQSAGHGLNLQDGGNIVVFFAQDWNLEYYQQVIERIGPVRQIQSGYDRPVYIYLIIVRGTVDELVVIRRESKREVQDILLDAVKARACS